MNLKFIQHRARWAAHAARLKREKRHMRIHIGDVIIVPTEATSPYGPGEIGAPRRQKLIDFMNGSLSPEWTAWYAPFHGCARIVDRSEVNWVTSGLAEFARTA